MHIKQILIAIPKGGFITLCVWNNGSKKKSRKIRRLLRCSILYVNLLKFSENQSNDFQVGFMLFFFWTYGNFSYIEIKIQKQIEPIKSKWRFLMPGNERVRSKLSIALPDFSFTWYRISKTNVPVQWVDKHYLKR